MSILVDCLVMTINQDMTKQEGVTNSSHQNPYLVLLTILDQGHQPVRQRFSIQENLTDTLVDSVRVLHADFVMGGSKAIIHFISRPIGGDAWVDVERLAHPGNA